MFTNLKIVKSGNLVEVFRFKDRIRYGSLDYKKSAVKIPSVGDIETESCDSKEQSLRQTKSRLKRLIYSNVEMWVDDHGRTFKSLYLTLTFEENLRDVEKAAYDFKKFIQKFNYEINKIMGSPNLKKSYIKYIAVPEFQKRGAVHFHAVLFNIPFIENIYDKLNEIWGKGYFIVETVKNVNRAVAYLSKYLRKEISDERITGRRYYPSRGLKKPIITLNEQNNIFVSQMLPEQAKVFEENYVGDYCGEYKYEIYDLNNFPENSDTLLAINQIMRLE